MHHPRPRLGLRSFFVVLTLVTLPVGYYVHLCQRQMRVVAEIERLGGVVVYDYANYTDANDSVHISGVEPPVTSGNWLVRFFGRDFCHRVVGVKTCNYSLVSQTLFPQQQHGPAYSYLEPMVTEFNKDTDNALTCLHKIGPLEFLDLSSTAATDTGLVKLHASARVECLNLRDTSVTDAGLDHLQYIRGLAIVNLCGTDVTDNGVHKLQAAMPHLKIVHESLGKWGSNPSQPAREDRLDWGGK